MKKKYIAPTVEIYNIENATPLLAGSDWSANGEFDGNLGSAHAKEHDMDFGW